MEEEDDVPITEDVLLCFLSTTSLKRVTFDVFFYDKYIAV
jgi:hypothetical protein